MIRERLINVSEKEYRGLNMPSYSLFKDLDENGPKVLVKSEEKKSKSLDFGSIVDNLLLTPGEFDSKFYVVDLVEPTASLLELAKVCIKRNVTDVDRINGISAELNLWSNTKDEKKRVEKFNLPIFWEYVKHSIDAGDKQVITSEVYSNAVIAVNSLKAHSATRDIFNHKDYINQAVFTAKIRDLDIKIMIDRINIFNNFVLLFDVKTGSPENNKFNFNFKSFKYYLQQALYWLVLNENISDLYDVKPMQFVYVNSINPSTPVIYQMTNKWIQLGLDGWVTNTGYKVKGIYELIDDYKWYIENQIFDNDREVIENDYRLAIDYPIEK